VIGFKRSISVFASKDGSWLITLCQISGENTQKNSRLQSIYSIFQEKSFTSILCKDATEFSGPELISDYPKKKKNTVEMLFLGKTDTEFSVPKMKGVIQTLISSLCKIKHLSWYGLHQCKQHG